MSDGDRTSLAVAAGVTAFALVYLCAAFLEWPVLTYFPEDGSVRLLAHAPAEAIPYFGLVLWGSVAGVDAATLTYLGTGALAPRAPLSRRLSALTAAWTLLSLLLAAAYFVFAAVT